MPRVSDRFVRDKRDLPPELEEARAEIEELAKSYGLDFFPVIYQMCTYQEINFLAAYGGFPTRYPHWRFGMDYIQTGKSYEYGLSKIYEMVINTNPSYAYLLDNNLMVDQKLVMAHVYGHVDFFKNNMWFAPTNRKMLDQMANHATRVRRIMDQYGENEVEEWIDVCLSIDNLVDPYAPHIVRSRGRATEEEIEAEAGRDGSARLPVQQEYMEDYINPAEFLAEQREQHGKTVKKMMRFPEEAVRDVMGFLVQHANLPTWKRQILSMLHAEAMYFQPQMQTKVMNEGWASYWDTKLMTEHIATVAEIIDYADHNSGTMSIQPGRFNPYILGVMLWRNIEKRWDKGQHGVAWLDADELERATWDTGAMEGREKIFQVRRTHNDISFIDEFFTVEFCREHGFFTTRYDKDTKSWIMDSDEFKEIKSQLLDMLASRGTPAIDVVDSNHNNRGELLLEHTHDGRDIDLEWAIPTMGNIAQIWGRPVHLSTRVGGSDTTIFHDGKKHELIGEDPMKYTASDDDDETDGSH